MNEIVAVDRSDEDVAIEFSRRLNDRLFSDLAIADDKLRALEAKLASRRLTPKETRTLKWAAAWVTKSSYKNQAATLLSLLERMK